MKRILMTPSAPRWRSARHRPPKRPRPRRRKVALRPGRPRPSGHGGGGEESRRKGQRRRRGQGAAEIFPHAQACLTLRPRPRKNVKVAEQKQADEAEQCPTAHKGYQPSHFYGDDRHRRIAPPIIPIFYRHDVCISQLDGQCGPCGGAPRPSILHLCSPGKCSRE